MSFKIVVDSCCELPEEYLQDSRFEIVPLGLEVGDYQIQDDENFDQAEFLKKVAEFKGCLIMDTRGVSSMYANDGGVIVTV